MASSDSAGETIAESPPSTPFHAVVEECEATPIESPFFPATPESGPVAAASPFVKVAEAELIAFEASVQGAPAAVPKPVSSEPEVAVDRHVIRGQVATACGLGLTQLNHVDKIHIVPDDRRRARGQVELRGHVVPEVDELEMRNDQDQETTKTAPRSGASTHPCVCGFDVTAPGRA